MERPKPRPPISLVGMDEEIERRKKEDDERRLNLLKVAREHYGIADGPYAATELLGAMLHDHMPAFQEGPGPGPETFWSNYRFVMLVAEVKILQAGGKSQAAALRELIGLPRYQNNPAKSLERRLQAAKKNSLVKFFETLAAKGAERGIDIWPDVIGIAQVSLPTRKD